MEVVLLATVVMKGEEFCLEEGDDEAYYATALNLNENYKSGMPIGWMQRD